MFTVFISSVLLSLLTQSDTAYTQCVQIITVMIVGTILVSLLAFIIVLGMRMKQSRAESIKRGLTKARKQAHEKFGSGFELAVRRLRAPSHARRSSSLRDENVFEITNPMGK